jgi:hypothetical protein
MYSSLTTHTIDSPATGGQFVDRTNTHSPVKHRTSICGLLFQMAGDSVHTAVAHVQWHATTCPKEVFCSAFNAYHTAMPRLDSPVTHPCFYHPLKAFCVGAEELTAVIKRQDAVSILCQRIVIRQNHRLSLLRNLNATVRRASTWASAAVVEHLNLDSLAAAGRQMIGSCAPRHPPSDYRYAYHHLAYDVESKNGCVKGCVRIRTTGCWAYGPPIHTKASCSFHEVGPVKRPGSCHYRLASSG